jgi:hypothetical protein
MTYGIWNKISGFFGLLRFPFLYSAFLFGWHISVRCTRGSKLSSGWEDYDEYVAFRFKQQKLHYSIHVMTFECRL